MQKSAVAVSLDDALASINLSSSLTRLTVTGITHDHRKVQPGYVFAALPGIKHHGADFASLAMDSGAVAIVTDVAGARAIENLAIPTIISANPRLDMAGLAQYIYGNAQAQLVSVGVTGTNGKTTTTFLIEAVLRATVGQTVLIGTTGVRFGDWLGESSRTTPEASDVHALLNDARHAGARALVMEVSSHALVLGRVDGIVYDVAVFTGLSPDHLDFHGTMEDYFLAKAQLFTSQRAERAVICVDSEWGQRLVHETHVPTITFGLTSAANWYPSDISTESDGHTNFLAHGPHGTYGVRMSLPGDFNVLNALAALAVADSLALPIDISAAQLVDVLVPGRLQRISQGQDFLVLVDYAHTPDAVERALAVARTCTSGRVIAVIGCGGDRDTQKRAPMGAAAALAADIVVVTDDNPRSEDPAHIRRAVLKGAHEAGSSAHIVEIGARDAAISYAIQEARTGDCVIILGKGHETGQEVAGVITHFDDREVAREALTRQSR